MNHFQYGFYDEISKIATDLREVIKFRNLIKDKTLPRYIRGEQATRRAQQSLKTVLLRVAPRNVPVSLYDLAYYTTNSRGDRIRVSDKAAMRRHDARTAKVNKLIFPMNSALESTNSATEYRPEIAQDRLNKILIRRQNYRDSVGGSVLSPS